MIQKQVLIFSRVQGLLCSTQKVRAHISNFRKHMDLYQFLFPLSQLSLLLHEKNYFMKTKKRKKIEEKKRKKKTKMKQKKGNRKNTQRWFFVWESLHLHVRVQGKGRNVNQACLFRGLFCFKHSNNLCQDNIIPYPICESILPASLLCCGYKRPPWASLEQAQKSGKEYKKIEREERRRGEKGVVIELLVQ